MGPIGSSTNIQKMKLGQLGPQQIIFWRGLRLQFIPNLGPKSLFWLVLQELCDFFWDLGLMLFDIPKDEGFPEILVLSNIFGFPAVNWAPNWTKTVHLHAFHLSQNSNF